MDTEYLKILIVSTPFANPSRFHYFNSIDSTNDEAKRIAESDESDCFVVIAKSQNAGRGRLNRKWYSPLGEGIYLSVGLRPSLPSSFFYYFVMLPCVSAVQAIKKTTGIDTYIKWPNDIFASGKKLGGILTESCIKNGNLEFVICGTGINVNTEKFDMEFLHFPTSLFLETNKRVSIEELTASFLDIFYSHYTQLVSTGGSKLFDIYKQYSLCLNKMVKLVDNEKVIEGIATDVDEKGQLILKCQDGSIKKLTTGDLFIIN